MTSRDVVAGFWEAMQANEWERAASYLTPECVIDWPCSGEQIVGRTDFARVQATYPSNTNRWSFDIHRLLADGNTVVSEVTVSDGEQAARIVAFSDVDGEQIAHQVEYWPMAYEPRPGREGMTRPTARVP